MEDAVAIGEPDRAAEDGARVRRRIRAGDLADTVRSLYATVQQVLRGRSM